MKKTLLILTALAMVLGMAMSASAAVTVGVTLTSPTITKAKGSCEKGGAVTFAFPQGSVLSAGDWWYMDLPEGATLCKTIDYMIVNDAAGSGFLADSYVFADSRNPTIVNFGTGVFAPTGHVASVQLPAAIPVGATGPMTTAAVVAPGAATSVTGNVAIRVIGQYGSRRVTLYVASDGTAANNHIDVGANSELRIKILDGQRYEARTGSVAGDTRIITNTGGITVTAPNAIDPTAAPTSIAWSYLPFGGPWGLFGQSTTDTWPGSASTRNVTTNEFIDPSGKAQVPYVENTLCLNAENASGNLFVSFASLNDKFTFTGDSQIAHTGAANTITLNTCVGNKISLDDRIKIVSGQGTCDFEYETHAGYCVYNSLAPSAYSAAIYLMSDSTFGELNDLYDVVIQSTTPGVYFMANITSIKGLGTNGAASLCTGGGTSVAMANQAYAAGSTDSRTAAPFTLAYPTSSCNVGAINKVDKIYTYGGSIGGIQNYKYLVFNLPTMVYSNTTVVEGTEVDLTVTLNKYPCGQIFQDTVTIGSFVTTCTSASSGSTTLLYPYMLGTKYTGWFAGFVVTNGGTAAGTATITFVDDNGNKATYTTDSIPAMGSFNGSFLTAADLTQDAGNSANFDMSENFVIKVVCKFSMGGGMAFLGNTNEGYAVGYDAYSTAW